MSYAVLISRSVKVFLFTFGKKLFEIIAEKTENDEVNLAGKIVKIKLENGRRLEFFRIVSNLCDEIYGSR